MTMMMVVQDDKTLVPSQPYQSLNWAAIGRDRVEAAAAADLLQPCSALAR